MAKRIVIADDSVTIQKAFAMTFGGEDVTIMSARSADEGLSMARQLRPELVIADGVMPGRSGYELCAAVKSDPNLQGTAVYILASSHQPYDDVRGHQSGADGHFLKPFETNAIIEKVREALARGPSPDARPVAPPARSTAPSLATTRPSVPQMPAVAMMDDEDEYGELTVDIPTEAPRPEPAVQMTSVPVARPQALYPSHPPAAPTAPYSPPPAAGMRPSLIPGARPGTVPLARPGTQPARPLGPGAAPPSRPPVPISRTLMGLPAANIPIPGTTRPAAPPARPASPAPPPAVARPASQFVPAPPAPLAVPPAGVAAAASGPATHNSAVSPLLPPADYVSSSSPSSTSAPFARPSAPPPAPAPSAISSAAISAAAISAVDQKMAAIAARGPEYEAIAKLSREIIEQIVWEIVPDLADAIIREHVEKRRPG